MTTNCHTNEDTMEDHTDPESVPEVLPRDIAAEWFARAAELNALANEQGVFLLMTLGGHGRPKVSFIVCDTGLVPDLSADREWSCSTNQTGTYRAYEIDGCAVGVHDQRASARVTNLQGA